MNRITISVGLELFIVSLNFAADEIQSFEENENTRY